MMGIPVSISSYASDSLHATAKHAATGSALSSIRLALHFLANFDIDLEELCDATVKTHGFTLVQVGLAVCGVDAFCGAGFDEAVSEGGLCQ